MKEYKAPNCISEDGRHSMVETTGDSIFYFECEHCFERFLLISETVAKQLNIVPVERNLSERN